MEAYILSMVLLFCDWGQTRTISTKQRYYENNLYLGKHPTLKEVDIYFIKVITANSLVWVLPIRKKNKKHFWLVVSVVEAEYVKRNDSKNIRVNFKMKMHI